MANMNTTAAAGLSSGMTTYYNKKLMQVFEPKLVHLQFCELYPLPRSAGSRMSFRKLIPVEESTAELTEGEPGEGIAYSEVEVAASIAQYGQYERTSDKLDMTHIDLNIQRRVQMMGDAGARALDAAARNELAKVTNVIYAGGKSTRSALTAEDKLTARELRRAVKILKNNEAKPFDDGCYAAIVNPDVIYDLQDDETFISVAKYQDKEKIYKGEIGRLFGVRLVETTRARVFEGAGASGADVASIVVLGRYAYGAVSISGSNRPRVIVKAAGSAGTSDPLDQLSSVGWKMDGFAVKLLQPEFAVRIECGFTA